MKILTSYKYQRIPKKIFVVHIVVRQSHGPQFLENDDGQAETINIERYRRLITDYFCHETENIIVGVV